MSNIINIGGGANGGGGSNVVPNPQGTATDTLTKIGIDGTIYGFAGSGDAQIDTLYTGTAIAGDDVNLSSAYTNYDMLIFKCYNMNMGGYFGSSWNTSSLTIGDILLAGYATAGADRRLIGEFVSSTTFSVATSENGTQLKEIVGYKFGGGSTHNYSTTEQVVGTWVDGSTLYEKTIVYSGNIGHSSYATIDNSLSYSGVGFFTVINASAKLANINTWFTYSVGGVNYDISLSDALGVYVENYSVKYNISDVVVTIRYTKSST